MNEYNDVYGFIKSNFQKDYGQCANLQEVYEDFLSLYPKWKKRFHRKDLFAREVRRLFPFVTVGPLLKKNQFIFNISYIEKKKNLLIIDTIQSI